jgi:hypothetical protein
MSRNVVGGLPLLTILRRRRRMLDVTLRLAFVVVLVIFTILRPVPAGDAHAYWAVNAADPYTRPVATQDAFTYTPPAALFFAVLGHLPFEVFEAIWTLLLGFALLWLTGPWALAFMVLPVVASDLYLGNIHVLLAAVVVGSLRRPGLWAIALLTKPSVGVGLLWFVVRREWTRLAVALGVTAALAALAFVVAPGLWPAWIDYILGTGLSPNTGTAYVVPIPLVVRLPVAVILVVWGARTNRPWTLPTASMLALPVLWLVGLAMLTGAFAVSAWGPLHDAARRWISKRDSPGVRRGRWLNGSTRRP